MSRHRCIRQARPQHVIPTPVAVIVFALVSWTVIGVLFRGLLALLGGLG